MNKDFIEFLVGGQRFSELKGYKFDKLIFSGFVLLVLSLFILLFLSYGSDRNYHIFYSCPLDYGSCQNPFFADYPVCESAWSTACSDRIVAGGFEFGKRAPLIVHWWGFIVGSLLIVAFIVNHFVHNKGKGVPLEDGE